MWRPRAWARHRSVSPCEVRILGQPANRAQDAFGYVSAALHDGKGLR